MTSYLSSDCQPSEEEMRAVLGDEYESLLGAETRIKGEIRKAADRSDEQFDITREVIVGQTINLHNETTQRLETLKESQDRLHEENGELREQLGELVTAVKTLSERKAAPERPVTGVDLAGPSKSLGATFESEANDNAFVSGDEPSVPSEIMMGQELPPSSSRKRKLAAERRSRSQARRDDDEQSREMKRLRSERDSATNDLRTLRRSRRNPMAVKPRNEQRPPASLALSNKRVTELTKARCEAEKDRAGRLFYDPTSKGGR